MQRKINIKIPTCAFSPNSLWKMPKVPGPQTSCVMSLSTFVQIFWPGTTLMLSLCFARIFSVMVIGLFTCTYSRCQEGQLVFYPELAAAKV